MDRDLVITDAHRALVRKHLESLPPFPGNTLEADFLKGTMGPLSERHFVIGWLDKLYAEGSLRLESQSLLETKA